MDPVGQNERQTYVSSSSPGSSTGGEIAVYTFTGLLYFHHPSVSEKTLCFRAVRPPRSNFDKTDREYSIAPTDDLIG